MTIPEFRTAIIEACDRTPFTPYTVELTDGTRFTVTARRGVCMREGWGAAWDGNMRLYRFTNDTLRAIHYEEPAAAAG